MNNGNSDNHLNAYPHLILSKVGQQLYFLNIYNPEQNIWNKIKKSSKLGQDQKTLIFAFENF